MSRKKKADTGGIITNLDVPVTAAERTQKQKDEWNTKLIEDSIKDAESSRKGRVATAGKVFSLDEKRRSKKDDTRMAASLDPQYIADPQSGVVIAKGYSKSDFEKLMQGHYCVRCEELQGSVPPDWAVADFVCEPAGNGRGCGFPRGREYWKALPFVITELPEHGEAGI